MQRNVLPSCLATALACCLLSTTALAVPVPGVVVDGDPLDVEYFAGSGSNTSYFVVDFIGGGSGPGETFAFAYQWDSAATSADALLALEAAGSLQMDTTDFGPGFGLAIDGLAFGADDDTPDFGVDSRFWNLYEGTLSSGTVNWAFSDFGISQRNLTDGSFDGFIAKTFDDTTTPRVPTVAGMPEPSTLVLVLLGAVGLLFFGWPRLLATWVYRRQAPQVDKATD